MLRLLVALLALLLALPASAVPACHETSTTVTAPMQHHEHRPAAPAAAHDCLGCVPPFDLAGGAVVSPWRPADRQRPPLRASTTAGALLVPLSPPPRAA